MTPTYTLATAPGSVPVLGHVLRLRGGLLRFLSSLVACGDLVEVRVLRWRGYVVCHPELVHDLLRHDRVFDKGGPFFDSVRHALGNGLATCGWPDHRRQRRLVQPSFAPDRLTRYGDVMTMQTAALLDSWRDGQTIQVHSEIRALTTAAVSRTLFAADFVESAALAAGDAVDVIARSVYRRVLLPFALLDRVPTPGNHRYADAVNRAHSAVDEMIRRYRHTDAEPCDVLSALLAARDEHDVPLSDEEIRDQALTLLVAGIETTAVVVAWAMDLLAHHTEVQHRLQTECDSVLGNRAATLADLARLPLTKAVVMETLRLYPPSWIFTRIATEDTRLGGHAISRGSILLYSAYLIHHNPALFPNPSRFAPDRWLGDQSKQISGHAWIPFGSGPRKCIGDNYALNFATIGLASIAAQWDLEPTCRTPARIAARASLAPRNLTLRLRRRKHSPLLVHNNV